MAERFEKAAAMLKEVKEEDLEADNATRIAAVSAASGVGL